MNAFDMARSAYSPVNAPFNSPRETEYSVVAKITRQLKDAKDSKKSSFAELAQALHENRVLWTRLASDVAEPSNALPTALKAQIFYLAKFTNHHTSAVLSGNANADILVEINTAIMRGLASSEQKQ